MTTLTELRDQVDAWPDDHPLRPAALPATIQAQVLWDAAAVSPNHFVRTLVKRLAVEWKHVAEQLVELADVGEPAMVGAAGALAAGTQVRYQSNTSDWAPLVRVMTRDGQVSLHVSDEGRDRYVNLTTLGSPVVVRP